MSLRPTLKQETKITATYMYIVDAIINQCEINNKLRL